MKPFEWSPEKNLWLKAMRGVSFDDFLLAFNQSEVIDTVDHPNQKKYPGQRIFIINIQDYCCMVPFIETEEKFFLKTIYRSRKAVKKYLRKENKL